MGRVNRDPNEKAENTAVRLWKPFVFVTEGPAGRGPFMCTPRRVPLAPRACLLCVCVGGRSLRARSLLIRRPAGRRRRGVRAVTHDISVLFWTCVHPSLPVPFLRFIYRGCMKCIAAHCDNHPSQIRSLIPRKTRGWKNNNTPPTAAAG